MSHAPWPYPDPVGKTDLPSVPTWVCPSGVCECHPVSDVIEELTPHRIVLFDEDAVRMPGARCRVWESGRLVNRDTPYADGEGSLELALEAGTESLLLEWAPPDTPLHPMLPFRITYHLELGERLEEGVARRLHNIGFCFSASLEENVRAFQRVYGPPNTLETGRPEDVDAQLRAYHDASLLPPLAEPLSVAAATPPASSGRGSARESIVTTPFEVGVEIGDHVPWTETDDLVIVDGSGAQVLRQPLGSGRSEGTLRITAFREYEKGSRYTVKVRFGDHAYIVYQALDIYDAVNPATLSPPLIPPHRVYIDDVS